MAAEKLLSDHKSQNRITDELEGFVFGASECSIAFARKVLIRLRTVGYRALEKLDIAELVSQ